MKWLSVYEYYANWVTEGLAALPAARDAEEVGEDDKYKLISAFLGTQRPPEDEWWRDH